MKKQLLTFMVITGWLAGGIPAALASMPPMPQVGPCYDIYDHLESFRTCPSDGDCLTGDVALTPGTLDSGEEFCRLTITSNEGKLLTSTGLRLYALPAEGPSFPIGSASARHESPGGPYVSIEHDILDAEAFNTYESLLLISNEGGPYTLQASSITREAGEAGEAGGADDIVLDERGPITSGVTFRSDFPLNETTDQDLNENNGSTCQLNPLAMPWGFSWGWLMLVFTLTGLRLGKKV